MNEGPGQVPWGEMDRDESASSCTGRPGNRWEAGGEGVVAHELGHQLTPQLAFCGTRTHALGVRRSLARQPGPSPMPLGASFLSSVREGNRDAHLMDWLL